MWIKIIHALLTISTIISIFSTLRSFKVFLESKKIDQKRQKVKIENEKNLNNLDEITAYNRSMTKKLFASLVNKFIKKPIHKDITLKFRDCLNDEEDNRLRNKVLGNANWKINTYRVNFSGFELKKIRKFAYEVAFLNDYPSVDKKRSTLVHEFVHVYLYSKENFETHEHNDDFYSKMDYFENWLDKEWDLTPRMDKGNDWQQHIDPKRKQERQEYYSLLNPHNQTVYQVKPPTVIYNATSNSFKVKKSPVEWSEKLNEQYGNEE